MYCIMLTDWADTSSHMRHRAHNVKSLLFIHTSQSVCCKDTIFGLLCLFQSSLSLEIFEIYVVLGFIVENYSVE